MLMLNIYFTSYKKVPIVGFFFNEYELYHHFYQGRDNILFYTQMHTVWLNYGGLALASRYL